MRTSAPDDLYVIWDLTYACPLRCVHCYSESGRRASRHLSFADQKTIADKIIAAKPMSVQFSGGEPLVLPQVWDLARYFGDHGIPVRLYSSGWSWDDRTRDLAIRHFEKIHVSVDAPAAALHDAIRGREGAFAHAMNALTLLDDASDGTLLFGIDSTVLRDTFDELPQFFSDVLPRFEKLRFFDVGAVVPTGLASRRPFAGARLLTSDQMAKLRDPAFVANLRARARPGLEVGVTDNTFLMMHPRDHEKRKSAVKVLQIEPDGKVRAMAIYEGTVGNLLEEPLDAIVEKVEERRRDPFVLATLGRITDNASWAAATRALDWTFGTEDDRERIVRRDLVPLERKPLREKPLRETTLSALASASGP